MLEDLLKALLSARVRPEPRFPGFQFLTLFPLIRLLPPGSGPHFPFKGCVQGYRMSACLSLVGRGWGAVKTFRHNSLLFSIGGGTDIKEQKLNHLSGKLGRIQFPNFGKFYCQFAVTGNPMQQMILLVYV